MRIHEIKDDQDLNDAKIGSLTGKKNLEKGREKIRQVLSYIEEGRHMLLEEIKISVDETIECSPILFMRATAKAIGGVGELDPFP